MTDSVLTAFQQAFVGEGIVYLRKAADSCVWFKHAVLIGGLATKKKAFPWPSTLPQSEDDGQAQKQANMDFA